MSQKKEYLLNTAYLKNRVAALGLKQWWLAEQVGVDRRTVMRWLQGQVRAIQGSNLEALLKVLNCQLADICVDSIADQLATAEDQKQAAHHLARSSLIDKLGPIGEWNVLESLLKATIVPNLPLAVLGELYNQLTVASWRQSKIDQANQFNQRAVHIAQKIQDNTLLAQAYLSQASILSWRGKLPASVEVLHKVLSLSSFIDEKTLGATYSNLGSVLYEGGDLVQGAAYLDQALTQFLVRGTPVNHSIVYGHLTIIYLKQADLARAESACAKSQEFAYAGNYRRGQIFAKLLRAEISAHRGINEGTMALVQGALSDFAGLNIEEGLNYEIAGRICRMLRLYPEAKIYLERGIGLAADFPVYQAALYFELARTLYAMGESAPWAAIKAKELYHACGAEAQVINVETFLDSIT